MMNQKGYGRKFAWYNLRVCIQNLLKREWRKPPETCQGICLHIAILIQDCLQMTQICCSWLWLVILFLWMFQIC